MLAEGIRLETAMLYECCFQQPPSGRKGPRKPQCLQALCVMLVTEAYLNSCVGTFISDNFILKKWNLLACMCVTAHIKLLSTSSLNQLLLTEVLVRDIVSHLYEFWEGCSVQVWIPHEKISHQTTENPNPPKSAVAVRLFTEMRGLSRSTILITFLATPKPALEICTFWSWIWPKAITVGAGFQSTDFITNLWNSKGLKFHVLVWRAAVTHSRLYNSVILTMSREVKSFLKVILNFYVRKTLSCWIFF